MRRHVRRLLFLSLVVLGVGAGLLAADWWICLPEGQTAHYVGLQECARCHQQAVELWTGSDHQRAMAPATPQTVLGNFDDQQFTHFGVTSKLFRRGDEFFITTDGPSGRMETFAVKHVFGVRPLQQYLVEFPDGRVQCLGVAWDTVRKRWFHLYPDEPIPAGDQLHWTKPLQNWNYMCAECHSTNLQKNYDLATNSYHTTFSEIYVSCETCHGPGSLHVKLADARKVFWDRRYGFGLPRLKDQNSRVEIETCAPCHARRRIVYPGFVAGGKFLDYYMPELLDGDLYYADGQILGEDYEYGSFTQSKMYHKNVRCTNCHDPHTMRVKFKDQYVVPITDNRLCGQCHVPAKYDGPAHHHHPDASKPGTLCIECHMPTTTYMVVDPRLDHSIRVPRPDLTVSLGIPNACNGCHHDQAKGETPQWAESKLRTWYGQRQGPAHFASAIAHGRQELPEGRPELDAVTRRKDLSAMVRASALFLLSRYGPEAVQAAAFDGLEDPEELVRAAAVRSLQHLPPQEIHRRLTPLLSDPIRAVRTEAVRVLSIIPRDQFSQKDQQAFDSALAEYMVGQEAVNDQPAAHLNMAVIYANLGQLDKAEQAYQTALRIDPAFIPARNNLAMLYGQQEKAAEAEKEFRKVIELEPKFAAGYYSLGLLLAENKDRLAEAAEMLATAARLDPRNARIHYNRGLALQRLGRFQQAEEVLKTAFELSPQVTDCLHALAILYAQQQRWPRAIACAEQLLKMRPNDPQWQEFLEAIRQQSQHPKQAEPNQSKQ